MIDSVFKQAEKGITNSRAREMNALQIRLADSGLDSTYVTRMSQTLVDNQNELAKMQKSGKTNNTLLSEIDQDIKSITAKLPAMTVDDKVNIAQADIDIALKGKIIGPKKANEANDKLVSALEDLKAQQKALSDLQNAANSGK